MTKNQQGNLVFPKRSGRLSFYGDGHQIQVLVSKLKWALHAQFLSHTPELLQIFLFFKDLQKIHITVKPRNSGQLEQLDFFRYCGVFRYCEDLEALNRSF